MTGKRVLYQEPQATFFHDVMTNLFTDKMTKAATYYNLHPSNPELMSWGNNAPKIKDLLQLSGVTDTYVTFEYLVPYNMKRIDCILLVGKGGIPAGVLRLCMPVPGMWCLNLRRR